MWRQPTATTISRSIPIAPRTLRLTGLTSFRSRHPYVAVREGFAYVAVILDAWSRRAIGYAISRSIDVRLTLAALNTAVERRKPPQGAFTTATAVRKADSSGRRNTIFVG